MQTGASNLTFPNTATRVLSMYCSFNIILQGQGDGSQCAPRLSRATLGSRAVCSNHFKDENPTLIKGNIGVLISLVIAFALRKTQSAPAVTVGRPGV